MSFCNLQNIPIELFDNNVLFEELIISNNSISEIPSNIQKLKFLKKLDISNNQLQSLPDSLLNCENFKSHDSIINIQNNPFMDTYLLNIESSQKLLNYLENKLKGK